jgi:hypothetical protein
VDKFLKLYPLRIPRCVGTSSTDPRGQWRTEGQSQVRMPRRSTKTSALTSASMPTLPKRSRWLRPASTPVRRNAFCSPPAWSPLRPVRDHTADGAPAYRAGCSRGGCGRTYPPVASGRHVASEHPRRRLIGRRSCRRYSRLPGVKAIALWNRTKARTESLAGKLGSADLTVYDNGRSPIGINRRDDSVAELGPVPMLDLPYSRSWRRHSL